MFRCDKYTCFFFAGGGGGGGPPVSYRFISVTRTRESHLCIHAMLAQRHFTGRPSHTIATAAK